MKDYKYFIGEYADCIAWILNEPTAIDVEYNFYRMQELEKELREYVNNNQEESEYGD